MSFISKLNKSEKKQIVILSIILVLIISFIVYVFVSIADNQEITMDEARTTAPRADKIDKLAIELTRLDGFTTFEGKKVSQYELQNPTDGGAGDDGTYDNTKDVVLSSVQEVEKINQSVALANGTTVQAKPTSKTLKQINREERAEVKANAEAAEASALAESDNKPSNLSDVQLSVVQ